MHARTTLVTTLTTTLTAAAIVLTAPAAQARPTYEFIDRSAFDAAPVVTSSGWDMSADTRGELGGHLTLSVHAADGTVPGAGACEPARVEALLTTTPGETFEIRTTGELCGHPVDGSPTLSAGVKRNQVTYTGPRTRVSVRSGLSGFGYGGLGAQGSVNLTLQT